MLLLTLGLASPWVTPALAAGGSRPVSASAVAPGATYVRGPAAAVDSLNGLALELPRGWFAIVPRDGQGSTTVANYDLERVESWMPEHSSHVLLPEMVKVDLSRQSLAAGETLESWIEHRRTEIRLGSPTPMGTREEGYPVSDAVAVDLGGQQGYGWAVEAGIASSLELAFPWGKGGVMLAVVMPADSRRLPAALELVGRVYAPGAKPSGREGAVAAAAANLVELADTLPAAIQAGECSLWTGSDSGSYAANTGITLYLPFFFQTWWQAGGAGAFWGNLFHGNCYDDYFAIDFNQMNSSCTGYLEDSGQSVYAAANGTAFTFTSTTGYGNRVDVVHSGGYMTRYGHLSSILVANNSAVTTQTVVGRVGATGNAAGPHLHFGFYQNGVSRCNRAGGCPNGEAAKSPQTQKPSPMNTNLGSRAIFDGGCFQAPP
ncbi:MAG: M23 family metallopeptidase [Thermoanaerobaculia bacterium]